MPKYQEFEAAFADYVSAKHGVACNTGTAALHLALVALGVGPGDEVIVPDFTMAACAFAVTYTGATPVFADILDDGTLNVDPEDVKRLITPKTKAIMAVHIYGRLCDMHALREVATEAKVALVEDASEAHGAVSNSMADVTCFSLYKNKIIHAEEGGICTTNGDELAAKMRYYKNMCFTEAHDYDHPHVGFNYRMPDSQAALALESLRNVDAELVRRERAAFSLDLLTPPDKRMPSRDVVWVYDTLADVRGENTRPFFKPLSSLAPYGSGPGRPNAAKWSKLGRYIIV